MFEPLYTCLPSIVSVKVAVSFAPQFSVTADLPVAVFFMVMPLTVSTGAVKSTLMVPPHTQSVSASSPFMARTHQV